MKKILIFIFVLSLFSCEGEVAPISFSEENFTSEEFAIIEVNIPKASDNTEVSKKINATLDAFVVDQINLENEPASNLTI